jgi:hypothetical protein
VHSSHFRGLPLSRQETINNRVENYQKEQMIRAVGALDSLDAVKKRSANLIPLVLNNYKTDKPLTAAVKDSIANLPTMANVQGQDPATRNIITPNVWISPHEAAAIYSQKGLPETIISKKGKSPLLNGVRIKNVKLSAKQLDIIRDDMVKNDMTGKIVEGLLGSLIYGGALMFPMFKHDNPVTAHLPVEALLKHGIAGKGCIDWWVVLDRWNCVHIPNWNPTEKDFLSPKQYYVPFLGSHVSGERCARINTAQQIGYWAVLLTLGWGLSDIPGWIESVYNYYNVMAAIPNMIAQMSVIVRTLNVDSYLATDGWDILKDIDLQNTAKVREASMNNPINMDVVGDLKALSRDFKEVPSLVRLIRQDVGGRADVPEESLFSCERGAFASGDPTAAAQEKQWESIRYMHREVGTQLKNIAMLEVINALGIDRDVLSALPYTVIEFDNPTITNTDVRSQIGERIGDMIFNYRGSGYPLDICLKIAESYGDESFKVTSELLEDVEKRQAEEDARAEEKHDKEMELLQAQIDLTKEQVDHVGDVGVGGMSAGKKPGKGEGYTRMEQKQKEKTRGTAARREGLQKKEAKRI